METRYLAYSLCLFKQPLSVVNHLNQYIEEISKKLELSIHM